MTPFVSVQCFTNADSADKRSGCTTAWSLPCLMHLSLFPTIKELGVSYINLKSPI